MDDRRRMALEILEGRLSISDASRAFKVTRKTARKWLSRAREFGLAQMSEMSRAPKTIGRKTDREIETVLLCYRSQYPVWGAGKLVCLMSSELGIDLPERTAERILKRAGLTKSQPSRKEPQRFERESCGALLQMDFKGLPKSTPYSLLTVLDDSCRFCLGFEPLKDKTRESVKPALWELFGEHGLPESMLMDHGDCWGSRSRFPSRFEVWLMKQGIKPIHGRPYHPQTQGKVERFHETAQLEVGAELVQASIELVRPVLREFVHRYNWIRPHKGLGMKTPGSKYMPFPKKRPDKELEHEIQEGAISRKVDANGEVCYKGNTYDLGKGLIGERVVFTDKELGTAISFAGFHIIYLQEL